MVETGSRRTPHGPVVIAVLVMLAVAGAVVDDRRGGAGHTSPAAGTVPLAALAGTCEVTR